MDPGREDRPHLEATGRALPHRGARCTLDFTNPLELLVATVLSALHDIRVNQVTRPYSAGNTPPRLTPRKPSLAELEQAIYTTGFYHQKAKSLKALCQALVAKSGGQVPASLDDLVKLPGIGRKTANVILGNAFDGRPGHRGGHAHRPGRPRLGLTPPRGPGKD